MDAGWWYAIGVGWFARWAWERAQTSDWWGWLDDPSPEAQSLDALGRVVKGE